MKSYLERLNEIAPVILNEEIDYLELSNAIKSYRELLLEISNLEFETEENRDNIALTHGLAIGPAWAARCLDDMIRTKKFVRGIHLAVSKIKTENKKPIQIVYCGTGPFATLILPLLSLYTSEEIQFTLVEVNPISFTHVKNIFKSLGAEAYIRNIILEDATKLKLAYSQEIDLVIIECLQHALAREPQVAITANLIKQCRKDILLIPEEISLHVSLLNHREEFNANTNTNKSVSRVDKKAFTLNKHEILHYDFDGSESYFFPKKEICYTNAELKNNTALAVTTTIQIFENEVLSNKESGLTIPYIFCEIDDSIASLAVTTQYEVGENPKLNVSIINK